MGRPAEFGPHVGYLQLPQTSPSRLQPRCHRSTNLFGQGDSVSLCSPSKRSGQVWRNANTKGFASGWTTGTQIGQDLLRLPPGPSDSPGEAASRFAGSPWQLDVNPPSSLVDLGHAARAPGPPSPHSITRPRGIALLHR